VARTGHGRYQLGERIWRLGHWVPDRRQLRDVSRPFLVDLYEAIKAPVILAGLEGDQVFAIDRICGRAAQHVWPYHVGFPALSHAAGITFLTWGDQTLPFKAAIKPTPALRRDLAHIKQRGYATSSAEGLAWVSAPLVDEERRIRAAVCIALPVGQGSAAAVSRVLVPMSRAMSDELARLRTAG
jgi:DNA-binding IclR family transcriptional regulator